MSVRITDIFVDKAPRDTDAEAKVMKTICKAFDDAGRPTLQGFHVSLSGTAMVTLTVPTHVNAAVADRTLVVNGKTHNLSHVHQVEVKNTFELVIKGFYNHQDSNTLEQCRTWFASFNRKQLSHTLINTRCDKDRGVGIERYVIRIRLCSSSRGEDTVE
ncbi:hypothetical protein B0H14DRAFT_3438393 [Mycena olivaceomarginata]|nr:hypothetical protein B0H14DRAFT_3438393 [Mycena olivaceomarginata]